MCIRLAQSSTGFRWARSLGGPSHGVLHGGRGVRIPQSGGGLVDAGSTDILPEDDNPSTNPAVEVDIRSLPDAHQSIAVIIRAWARIPVQCQEVRGTVRDPFWDL